MSNERDYTFEIEKSFICLPLSFSRLRHANARVYTDSVVSVCLFYPLWDVFVIHGHYI